MDPPHGFSHQGREVPLRPWGADARPARAERHRHDSRGDGAARLLVRGLETEWLLFFEVFLSALEGVCVSPL